MNQTITKSRRPGSGKRFYGAQKIDITVMDRHLQFIEMEGGNRSLVIQEALDALIESRPYRGLEGIEPEDIRRTSPLYKIRVAVFRSFSMIISFEGAKIIRETAADGTLCWNKEYITLLLETAGEAAINIA